MKKNKKVPTTAAIVCFTVVLWFLLFQLNFYRVPISTTTPPHSSAAGTKYWKLEVLIKPNILSPPSLSSPQVSQITCDRTNWMYDLCKINGSTVLDPTTSTFYILSPPTPNFKLEKIKPYPRKWEEFPMAKIKELTLITSSPPIPTCQVHHSSPALVFSAGGYTGNLFHEFSDGFIPLFITINSLYEDDQDIILVISKARDWWLSKYTDLLHTFNKNPIINLDNDTTTHCFPSATLGLISHGFLTINPALIPNSKTFNHFRALLDKTYGGTGVRNLQTQTSSQNLRPRLVLVSRSGNLGRVILNQNEVKQLGYDVGFDVITFEPTSSTPLHQAYALINSSHAMIGVHGAALTHLLFLRPGAVFVQVVPLGLEWAADTCFGSPARAMGLEYMEYEIEAGESSLIDKYDKNSLFIKNSTAAVHSKDWSAMKLYLKEQDVRLDLLRLEKYLKKAYYKAKNFMKSQT